MQVTENDHLVLVCGKASTGKSMSLRELKNPEGVIYLNCEAGKKLPFKSKFKEFKVTDPFQVQQAFQEAEAMPEVHSIVVDSLTYLMDMFESLYVVPKVGTKEGMKAWSDYAQFFKTMMQQWVASSTKNVIFLAHTKDILNESEMVMETKVPIKGSLANNGVESYFSTIISTKKLSTKRLEGIESDLLNISEKEAVREYKYVFQTDITKETINEAMRSPWAMWNDNETYIDNNLQHVIDRLHNYYGSEAAA